MNLGMFWAFSGYGPPPPRTPKGPKWFPMDNLVCHEKLRQNTLLHIGFCYGKTGLCFMEISDDLRHFLAAFRLSGAPKAPQGSSKTSNGQPSVP